MLSQADVARLEKLPASFRDKIYAMANLIKRREREITKLEDQLENSWEDNIELEELLRFILPTGFDRRNLGEPYAQILAEMRRNRVEYQTSDWEL
jgi:hypothetical protein